MTVVGCIVQGLEESAEAARKAAEWLTAGPKKVFSDVGAMSDALRLTQRINEIIKAIFASSPIEHVAGALRHVTDFIGARGIIGRIADLASFSGAWTAPLMNGPNLFWVGNKVTSLIGDIGSTVKWLASIEVFGGVLSSQIKEASVQFVSWGNKFNFLKGVGDFSCVTSSLFDLVDVARQAIDELRHGVYLRDGAFMAKTAGCHAFSIAGDVAKVAGCVLSNIPGVHVVVGAVAAAVGAVTSLSKFYVEQYWKDPGGSRPPAGLAMAQAHPDGNLPPAEPAMAQAGPEPVVGLQEPLWLMPRGQEQMQ
jgi:hypothetical protein